MARSTFTTERMGRKRERAAGTAFLILFFALLVGIFSALWVGVFLHLEGGWGIVLGVLALVERVFRIIKLKLKSNGTAWLDM